MTESADDKKKRAGKRYTYSRAAQCQVSADQILEVQMLNISASGIQFAARTKIESKEPIRVRWRDTQFGLFEPTLVIAREVHKPENPEFQYYYGSQYYNLSNEAKENLLKLLKHFKDEDKKTAQQQVLTVTPLRLFDILEQGTSFLRQVFANGASTNYFDNILKEIADYEKAAFLLDDEVSYCIQKLTTHNFHCNLLGMMTANIVEMPELRQMYFQYIIAQLQKISAIENEVETVIRNLLKSEGDEEEKKNVQKLLNESSNRLFYTKQSLLQSVVETFSSVDTESPEFKNTLGKIKEEYEKVLEFLNPEMKYESLTYKRRSKMAEESKAEQIVDVPVMVESSPRYTLWFLCFVLLLIGAAFGYSKFLDYKNLIKMNEEMALPLEIIADQKSRSQLDITVRYADWMQLKEEQKKQVRDKVQVYIKSKNIGMCMIFNEKKVLLTSVRKSM